MPILLYSLCLLTAFSCAGLLLRAHRQTRYQLLFWAGWYFVLQSANNVLLIIDKALIPDVDLLSWRLFLTLAGVTFLMFGLIWESA